MKENKFRLWDKVTKSMVYPFDTFKHNWKDYMMNLKGNVYYKGNYSEDFDVMNYVNRKDKNNKEIYEGDIVLTGEHYYISDGSDGHSIDCRIHDGTKDFEKYSKDKKIYHVISEVKFDPNIDHCGFSPFTFSNKPISCQVIGNIYENPELKDKYSI